MAAGPLRPLLRSNTPYLWTEDHTVSFAEVKKALTAPLCYRYYNQLQKLTYTRMHRAKMGFDMCCSKNKTKSGNLSIAIQDSLMKLRVVMQWLNWSC